MRYEYAPSLAKHIPTIQAALPPIKSREDLDVTTLAIPEFNAYTGEWFMSWLLDAQTEELFLYYPSIGEWQKKYDVTAESWIANAVYVGRDVEPANSIPERHGYGPLTDALTQANQRAVVH